MSETRVVLPHLEKVGPVPSSGESRQAHHVGISSVGRARNANVNNKRIKTGLASGLHGSHPGPHAEHHPSITLAADNPLSSQSNYGLALDSRATTPAPDNSMTHVQNKSICLPVIETLGTDAQMGHQWQSSGQPLPSPTDVAYIRSRSVTPSPLGAPRDLMPRSKKTALFTGYLPDLPKPDAVTQEFSLSVEGHHDLRLPPRRTPTEPRKIEVCDRPGEYSTDGSVRTIFHCPRCLKHWSEHGTTPANCYESEKPTLGPEFVLNLRNHEILREFESLSREDMHRVADMIRSRGSAKLTVDSCLSVTSPRRPKIEDDGAIIKSKALADANESKQVAQIDQSNHTESNQAAKIDQSNHDMMHLQRRVDSHAKDYETHNRIQREEHVTSDSGEIQHTFERIPAIKRAHDDKVDTEDKAVAELDREEISEKSIGQYGPDGSFYPGHYGPDGRFVPACCIAPNGQQYSVVMGPDGRFYVNARYGSDGRFILGTDEADRQGVMFLTASEMAALKTAQKKPKQGVVGPDGLFYPSGFYQSDGSFVPGGPPHAGHPSVWGPTLGKDSGYKFPPTEFGPAWPPGAPVPYSHEDNGLTFLQKENKQEQLRIHPDQSEAHPAEIPTMMSPDPDDSQRKNGVMKRQQEMNSSDVSDEEKDKEQNRDLFLPWGREDELQNVQTSVLAAPRQANHANDDQYALNVDITVPREQGQNNEFSSKQMKNESLDFDDLDKDMPLSRLDSKMTYMENGDEARLTPYELNRTDTSQGVAANQNGDEASTSAVRQVYDEFTDVDLQAKASVLNEKVNDVKETASGVGLVSTHHGHKRRESTAAYMGVTDQTNSSRTDSLFKSESSESQDIIPKARRGSMAPVSERRGSKAIPIKPGKNLAVKNVTGKPERKPGLLERHMFATPHAELAKTNAMGVSGKRDSLRGSHGLISTTGPDKNNKSIKEDTMTSKPKLPSIGGGEPTRDAASSRSPSPIKQTVSPIGSGEKRTEAADSSAVSTVDSTASEPAKRGTKVMKKTGKEIRKTATRKKHTESIADPIESVSKANAKAAENRPTSTLAENKHTSTTPSNIQDTGLGTNTLGTYHDIIRSAENTMSSREEITKSPTKSTSLLDRFSQFQLNMPSDSAKTNNDQGASYRMTYSTLPSFGARAPQSTAPPVNDMGGDARKKNELKPVKSKSIPFDFEHVERGYDNRARKTSSSRTIKSKKSSSKKLTRQRSTSSASSRASSAASSVWESVSDIWKRHKDEMTNLQKCVENSYLPLTSAFTFSFFPIAPAHAEHNRVLYEKAAAIKRLRKPIKFNKTRGGRTRKIVPVKTVAPVK